MNPLRAVSLANLEESLRGSSEDDPGVETEEVTEHDLLLGGTHERRQTQKNIPPLTVGEQARTKVQSWLRYDQYETGSRDCLVPAMDAGEMSVRRPSINYTGRGSKQ